MKKLTILLLLTIVSALAAHAQSEFYQACRGDNNLETVYIGKAMLQMVKTPGLKVNNMDFNKMINIIDNIQVISAENEAGVKKLNELISKYINPQSYEIMLETTDKDDEVVMYTKMLKNNLHEYLIITTEPNEKTVIIITGELTPNDMIDAKNGLKTSKK